MKEFVKKGLTVIALILVLVSSAVFIVKSIPKVVDANADEVEEIDENKINPLYELNLEKYVNYDVDGNIGTLVQFDLKTGIEYWEDQAYRPLNSTGILLNLPKIENEYPESVEIVGKSTKATNGSEESKNFNYLYDDEQGQLKLAAVNEEDQDGNKYSEYVDNARDEYSIICYYSSNCYTDRNVLRNLDVSGFVQMDIENEYQVRKRVDVEQNYEVAGNISGLVSTEIQTSDIYNGFINSNAKNGTNYRTEFVENMKINISKNNLADEMIVNIGNDEIIYKSTKIDKNKVLEILGEDGYLQILNENGDVLGEVNKNTEVEENGIYEISYDEDTTGIIIRTSNLSRVGEILLQNERAIKETVTEVENNRIGINSEIRLIKNVEVKVEKEETEEEKVTEENETEEKIEDEVVEETKIEQQELYRYLNNNIIEVKDAETKIDVSVNSTEWTNNEQNELIFTAKLLANSNKYNLFENPIIEIDLPSEVEKVILEDASLLYDENLIIKNIQVVDKENNKALIVEMEGVQTQYNQNSIVDGAEIIIPATVIINKDAIKTITALF